MDFAPFPQNYQSSGSPPDGFAIVPLHLFFMIANHLPFLPVPLTLATVANADSTTGLYERAMASSPN